MKKNQQNKWWRYLIVSFLGIFLFSIFIPSCTYLSSANFDVFVRDKKPEAIADEKSLAEILANLPTAEQIHAIPLAEHPRLLASEARFAEIKEQINSDATMEKWYEQLREKAESYLKEGDLPQYEVIDTRRLLATSQRVQRQVSTFALLYNLDRDPRYLNKAWQELSTAAKFPDWNPVKFLDTAEMTAAFAIGYDWLYPYWNQTQRGTIRQAIVEKGLKPALLDYRQNAWWTTIEHNWNQVCNGGIIMGSLAVLADERQIASQALFESLQRLPLAMQHYAPDGGWEEGISYWHYATLYNTLALSALQTSFDTDFDLASIAGFAEAGWFPIYMTGAFGLTFNFGDAKDYRVRAPELLWLADRFGTQDFADYQHIYASPEAIDLVWNTPHLEQRSQLEIPPNKHFDGVDVVSLRSDWDAKGIFVGFKAGDNQASHSNLDIGTFVIDALGVRWAVDLGRGDYTVPGYFDLADKRWDFYRIRPEGQNTLVIDPEAEAGQKVEGKGTITRFSDNFRNPLAIADLTAAYSPKVKDLHRGVSIIQNKQILIQDEIETEKPVDILWFMHTQADIQIAKDARSAILTQDGVRLYAQLLDSCKSCLFDVRAAQPLATSPQVEGQDRNKDIRKLTVRADRVSKIKIAVLLTPLKKNRPIPRRLPQAIDLANW